MATLFLHWSPYLSIDTNSTLFSDFIHYMRNKIPIDLFCSSQYIPAIQYTEQIRDSYYIDYPKTKPPIYVIPFINDLSRLNQDLDYNNDLIKHIQVKKQNKMIKIADVPLYQQDKHRCDYKMFQEYLYEFFLRLLDKINKKKVELDSSYKHSTIYHILLISHQNYLFDIFRKLLQPTDILVEKLEFYSMGSFYPLTDSYYLSRCKEKEPSHSSRIFLLETE